MSPRPGAARRFGAGALAGCLAAGAALASCARPGAGAGAAPSAIAVDLAGPQSQGGASRAGGGSAPGEQEPADDAVAEPTPRGTVPYGAGEESQDGPAGGVEGRWHARLVEISSPADARGEVAAATAALTLDQGEWSGGGFTDWEIGLAGAEASMPARCGGPAGGVYTARQSGEWGFDPADRSQGTGACAGEAAEVSAAWWAMGRAASWDLRTPDQLVLTGPDCSLYLTRVGVGAPSLAAFAQAVPGPVPQTLESRVEPGLAGDRVAAGPSATARSHSAAGGAAEAAEEAEETGPEGFSPDQLDGQTWKLDVTALDLGGRSVDLAAVPLALTISDTVIQWHTGCDYGASRYSISGDGVGIVADPWVADAACEDGAVGREGLVEVLGGLTAWGRPDEATLVIVGAVGSVTAARRSWRLDPAGLAGVWEVHTLDLGAPLAHVWDADGLAVRLGAAGRVTAAAGACLGNGANAALGSYRADGGGDWGFARAAGARATCGSGAERAAAQALVDALAGANRWEADSADPDFLTLTGPTVDAVLRRTG
ncbi:MAG: hypothetical protein LBT54_00550 [Bifidobacteriaceae bacterium]|jgi:hypothetical protein|nr:hypothetical protein [Bifidobacteriaceae bacterium]